VRRRDGRQGSRRASLRRGPARRDERREGLRAVAKRRRMVATGIFAVDTNPASGDEVLTPNY